MDYSADAKQLTSLFTQHRNSINVYTEDNQKDKKFYVTLFKRLFHGSEIIINDITPLGCCDDVISACSKDNDPYPKIYIVDGDIHLMTIKKPRIDHLYILNRYCIENFIIDETAFYTVFDELDYEHNIEAIKSLVNYNKMMDDAAVLLMELFQHFAVSQNVKGHFTLKDVFQVIDNNGEISPQKINTEKQITKNDVCKNANITSDEYDALLNSVSSSYRATRENMITYVSGKDYILPYIISYGNKKLSKKIGLKKEQCVKSKFFCNNFRKFNIPHISAI